MGDQTKKVVSGFADNKITNRDIVNLICPIGSTYIFDSKINPGILWRRIA